MLFLQAAFLCLLLLYVLLFIACLFQTPISALCFGGRHGTQSVLHFNKIIFSNIRSCCKPLTSKPPNGAQLADLKLGTRPGGRPSSSPSKVPPWPCAHLDNKEPMRAINHWRRRKAVGKVVRGQCKITFLSLLMRRLQWITAWASLIRPEASELSPFPFYASLFHSQALFHPLGCCRMFHTPFTESSLFIHMSSMLYLSS